MSGRIIGTGAECPNCHRELRAVVVESPGEVASLPVFENCGVCVDLDASDDKGDGPRQQLG